MRHDDIEIRAVLDSSAILSYARGYIDVGELLVDIADEGAYTGLPTVALLDAYTQVGADRPARARLGVLAALPGVEVLPLGPAEAAEVAKLSAWSRATWPGRTRCGSRSNTTPTTSPASRT